MPLSRSFHEPAGLLVVGIAAQVDPALPGGELDKRAPGVVRDLQRADHVQACVHQRLGLGGVAALADHPVYDVPDARIAQIAHVVDGEVDAVDQGAAVDPLAARVPALDRRGGVQDGLAHESRLGHRLYDAGLGAVRYPVLARQAQGADYQLDRALEAAELRLLEEVGVEQHPEDRPDVVSRLHVRLGQGLYGAGVSGRRARPLRDRGLAAEGRVVGECEAAPNGHERPEADGLQVSHAGIVWRRRRSELWTSMSTDATSAARRRQDPGQVGASAKLNLADPVSPSKPVLDTDRGAGVQYAEPDVSGSNPGILALQWYSTPRLPGCLLRADLFSQRGYLRQNEQASGEESRCETNSPQSSKGTVNGT